MWKSCTQLQQNALPPPSRLLSAEARLPSKRKKNGNDEFIVSLHVCKCFEDYAAMKQYALCMNRLLNAMPRQMW